MSLSLQEAVAQLLKASHLDPKDPDLSDTPERVATLWRTQFLAGYGMNPAEILGNPVVEPDSSDAVFVTGLAFHSMCPHHLMPYQGLAHVALHSPD